MSKELAFSPRTCMGQGSAGASPDFRFWILDFRVAAEGCSYQTEPAEMSRRPSLLKSPMPTPSERKARSRVVFLKLTFADLASPIAFDDGYGRAGTGAE